LEHLKRERKEIQLCGCSSVYNKVSLEKPSSHLYNENGDKIIFKIVFQKPKKQATRQKVKYTYE
ncbi:mCG1040936, partial [Mus musculus]